MVESDIRYYRRRACEEMAAANRAVTAAARDRRLLLVDRYVDRLRSLDAPSPFDEELAATTASSAFAWKSTAGLR